MIRGSMCFIKTPFLHCLNTSKSWNQPNDDQKRSRHKTKNSPTTLCSPVICCLTHPVISYKHHLRAASAATVMAVPSAIVERRHQPPTQKLPASWRNNIQHRPCTRTNPERRHQSAQILRRAVLASLLLGRANYAWLSVFVSMIGSFRWSRVHEANAPWSTDDDVQVIHGMTVSANPKWPRATQPKSQTPDQAPNRSKARQSQKKRNLHALPAKRNTWLSTKITAPPSTAWSQHNKKAANSARSGACSATPSNTIAEDYRLAMTAAGVMKPHHKKESLVLINPHNKYRAPFFTDGAH